MPHTATKPHDTKPHEAASSSLGSRLRELREAKHLSQEALAKKIGAIPQTYISRFERESVLPKESDLKLISKTLAARKSQVQTLHTELTGLVDRLRQRRAGSRQPQRDVRLRAAKQESVIGDRIISLRTTQGLTRAELSRRAGVHVNHLAQIERGTVRAPNTSTLDKLAAALGTSITGLLDASPAQTDIANHVQPTHTAQVDTWVRQPGLFFRADIANLIELSHDKRPGRAYAFVAAGTDSTGAELVAVYRANAVHETPPLTEEPKQ